MAALVPVGVALVVASNFVEPPAAAAGAAISGALLFAYGVAVATHAYGVRRSVWHDPYAVPRGLPVEAFEGRCRRLASSVSRPPDGWARAAATRAPLPGTVDLRTECGPRPRPQLRPVRESPFPSSPAALNFDVLMTKSLYRNRLPYITSRITPACPADHPSSSQIGAFLERTLGKAVYLPAVGATVRIVVTCVLIRGCSTLSGTRSLMHVEFIVLREGDVMAVHYEAHVATKPIAILWFSRLGEVVSADARSCTT